VADVCATALIAADSELLAEALAAAVSPELGFSFTVGATSHGDPRISRWALSGRHVEVGLDESAFLIDLSDSVLFRVFATVPLFAHAALETPPVDGSVLLDVDDTGRYPGLAFSSFRPYAYLVPDCGFILSRGYADVRSSFIDIPRWEDRAPVAIWRGATNGPDAADWRELPRIRLCRLSTSMSACGLLDARITRVTPRYAGFAEQIASCDLLSKPVPPSHLWRYRYAVDIDGNSNSWRGLYEKLCSGSAVLKVQSQHGYRQWYYDRLRAWEHFVPVRADMTDLPERLAWLRENDAEARAIGDRGREFARSLEFEQELAAGASVVRQAIEFFGGEQVWQAVAERFPELPDGFEAHGRELVRAGDLRGADAVLSAGAERHPTVQSLAIRHADVGARMEDWPTAVARFSAATSRFPENQDAHLGLAAALFGTGRTDEAEHELAAVLEKVPDHQGALLLLAETAARRRDWGTSAKRFADVRQRYPSLPAAWTEQAVALRELGALADAEELLQEAGRRFPRVPRIAEQFALVAEARGDSDEAASRWLDVRSRFPARPLGYLRGARCAKGTGAVHEALALLREAESRFPEDVGTALELARAEQGFGDSTKAGERWSEVTRRFADEASVYAAAGRGLHELGLDAHAESILAIGIARFPRDPSVALQHARLPVARRDWATALTRFTRVADQFPDNPEAAAERGTAFLELGDLDAAESALREAAERFPAFSRAFIQLARVSQRRGDSEAAVSAWATVRRLFPTRFEGFLEPGQYLARLGRTVDALALVSEGEARFPENPALGELASALRARASAPR
jgi:tetratricopeptide (TPR) repeat protein